MGDVDIYEAAYGAWMDALRGIKSPSEIHKILTSPKNSKLTDPIRSLQVQTVNQWFKRRSVPKAFQAKVMPILESLIEEFVKEFPKAAIPGVNFHDTWLELENQRNANSTSGKRLAKNLDDLYLDGVIGLPVSWATEFDLLDLNLGSGETDGDIPSFVMRDISQALVESIDNPADRIICLVGQYKSGKTRTLIEGLRTSKMRSSNVFWLNPGFERLGERLMALKESELKDSIFIIDDLQRFSYSSENGLTLKLVNFLSSLGKILVTVGEADFLQWDLGSDSTQIKRSEHSASPSLQLRQLLTRRLLHLSPKFSESEIIRAAEPFGEQLSPTDIEYLPSYLASTRQLVSRAKLLIAQGSEFDVSFMKAVIDARVLYPSGITMEKLKGLVNKELESTNAIWSDEAWNNALQFCTRGIAPGSPHSILQKMIEDRQKFNILDAVWQDIKPKTWDSRHLRPFASEEVLDFAENIFYVGFENDAIETLEEVVDKHLDYAPVLLGILYIEKRSFPEAVKWLETAIANDNILAHSMMGNAQMLLGHYDLATIYYQKAVELDEDDGLRGLGSVSLLKNDLQMAVHYFRAASKSGDLDCKSDLGFCLYRLGRISEAKKVLAEAAQGGVSAAYLNLGLVHSQEGNRSKAIDSYKKAGELGLTAAWNNLGFEFELESDLIQAKSYYQLAYDAGLVIACGNLGRVQIALGEFEAAEISLCNGINRGDSLSLYTLGEYEANKGNTSKAKALFIRSALTGTSVAWLAIGNLYANELHYQLAQKSFSKARDLHLLDGFYNLARIWVEKGEPLAAKNLLVEGLIQSLKPVNRDIVKVNTDDLRIFGFEFGVDVEKLNKFQMPKVYNFLLLVLKSLSNQSLNIETLIDISDAGYATALNTLGHELLAVGDTRGALEAWEKGIQFGNPESFISRGMYEFDLCNYKAAAELFKKAADKGAALGWNNLGCVFEKEGSTKKAEKCYRKAVESGLPLAAANLAILLIRKNSYDEALAFAKIAVDAEIPDGMVCLGNIHEHDERRQEALDLYQRVADLDLPVGYYNVGRMQLEDGDRENGLRNLRIASELGFSNADVELASDLEESGRIAEAEKVYLKAIAADNDIAKVCYAGMLLENGREEEGLAILEKTAAMNIEVAYGPLAKTYESLGRMNEATKYAKLSKKLDK